MADALIKHQFVSLKADGPDNTVVRPSDWNAALKAEGGLPDQLLGWDAGATLKAGWFFPTRHFDQLLNNSGGSVAVGDILVTDPSLDSALTSTTVLQDPRPVRVAAEAINNGVVGRFESTGRVSTVNVQGAVTRGDYLGCSTTAKQAISLGSTAVDGAFARALTSFGGPGAGSVVAVLFGVTLQVKAIGSYTAHGVTIAWNSSTILDVTAHSIQMRDGNDRAYVKHAPAPKQINIGITGPGGRDQAGAFSANSYMRIYALIKADGTYDVVGSVNTPPTGPDLSTIIALTTYLGWAYLGTWPIIAGGVLARGIQVGSQFNYEGTSITQVLTAGNATVETLVSVVNQVPPEALEMELEISASATTVSQANALRIRSLTTIDLVNFKTQTTAPGTILERCKIPNRA